MNFSTLKTELAARGYDFLDSTRQGYMVNAGYHRLCEKLPWPFLETTSGGSAPLSISDLRQVLYVVDATNLNVLQGSELRQVVDRDPNFTATGNPAQWYFDGLTTVKVWPPNTTANISVRYLKVPADLTGTDTPVVPTRYHTLIVDFAVLEANADDEEWEGRDRLEAEVDRKVGEMASTLLARNLQGPQYMVLTDHRNY